MSTERTVMQSARKSWWWSFTIWFVGRRNRWVLLGTETLPCPSEHVKYLGYDVSHWRSFVLSLSRLSSSCPSSRWRSLTTLCGCCSVFFSLAAMSRGRSSSRSSKVSRQHSPLPPPHSSGIWGISGKWVLLSQQMTSSICPSRSMADMWWRNCWCMGAFTQSFLFSSFRGLIVWKEEWIQTSVSSCAFISLLLESVIFIHAVYFIHSNKELVAAVMQSFKGHVRPMLRHAAASSIIEYAYNDKAVLAQRLMLTEELYGNTFAVCKVRVEICLIVCELSCLKKKLWLRSWSPDELDHLWIPPQVPGLETEQEFIFRNQTQRHLRLLWKSLGCAHAANILRDWLNIPLLLVDRVQHHRESHRGEPRQVEWHHRWDEADSHAHGPKVSWENQRLDL